MNHRAVFWIMLLCCFLSEGCLYFNDPMIRNNVLETNQSALEDARRYSKYTWRVIERKDYYPAAPMFPSFLAVVFDRDSVPLPTPIVKKVEFRLNRSDNVESQNFILPSWSPSFRDWAKLKKNNLAKLHLLDWPRGSGYNAANYLKPEKIEE